MKLVIQIPCWNEEENIAEVLSSLPECIDGIDTIEKVVIDDGSNDNTVSAAKEAGADKVITLKRHSGLAAAFTAGIEEAVKSDADILVNTDADMQYPSSYIKDLVKPVIDNRADIVIGDRLSHRPAPFGFFKMFLERIGTSIVSFLSGTGVKDAASGFRAFSREVFCSMIIHDDFSYTLESLLLAGMRNYRIVNVTIPVNEPRRKSRLVKSVSKYIFRSWITITRIFLMYHPLRFFAGMGMIFLAASFLLGVRFLYFYVIGQGAGHIQSLILLAVLAGMGAQSIILGLVADVIAANRRLLEELRLRMIKEK